MGTSDSSFAIIFVALGFCLLCIGGWFLVVWLINGPFAVSTTSVVFLLI